MALPENRKGVLELLEIFNQRILGQTRPAMACNCGAIHHGPATAVEIDPGGDDYPGQETHPALWSVRMVENSEGAGNRHYWYCLSEFIPYEELVALFDQHLGVHRSEDNPYKLLPSDTDRIELGYGLAVRIKDNDRQTRFCFDWGVDQPAAERILKLITSAEEKTGRDILSSQTEFLQIVDQMKSLAPEVYKGGPDPELPFESNWLLDYQAAIKVAEKSAKYIFVQNCGTVLNRKGKFHIGAHIVFSKK